MRATWKPHEKHGTLTKRSDLPDTVFAFPKERKEPLTDARHVRNAVARFDQVTDVPAADRELAFANIKKAAKYYDVDLSEADWHELGTRPSTGRTAADRERSARKAVATRKAHATGRKKTASSTSRKKTASSTGRKKTASSTGRKKTASSTSRKKTAAGTSRKNAPAAAGRKKAAGRRKKAA